MREQQRISVGNVYTSRAVALRYTQQANDTAAVRVSLAAAAGVLANPRLGVTLLLALDVTVNSTGVPIRLAANGSNDDCVTALAAALGGNRADFGCAVAADAAAWNVEVAVLAGRVSCSTKPLLRMGGTGRGAARRGAWGGVGWRRS